MANYGWIIEVIEDLEKFADNENLDLLSNQLKRARVTVEQDIISLLAKERNAGTEDVSEQFFARKI